VALLSSLVVATSLKAGLLHAQPIMPVVRSFFGLRHRERYRSKAADALLNIV
jgi:hypothetical protein